MDEINKLQNIIDTSENIVFFGGAGVSTESGLKDFRGKNGLYKEIDNDYPPEYMLSIKCLLKEPDLFFDYYRKNLDSLNIEPNITHKYLTKLEESGKLKAIVTQNIDGLHQRAGSKNVLEVHGTTYKNYCMKCGKEYPFDYIFKSKGIPKCSCGGTIRPDVTLYGEMLPEAYSLAVSYIMKADTLIVAGTSLTVEPAASLLRYFDGKHLVIINNTPTPYDDYAELVINKPLGEIFSKLK
jgi:NAD-dependent deacetylase